VCLFGGEEPYVTGIGLSAKTGQAYQLPSEAEWEYAARAGTTTPFWTGATISTGQANYDGTSIYGVGRKGDYRERTVAAGSLPANPWGLHEVHGNVWEWVEDCYHDSYKDAPADGRAWVSNGCPSRVVRGGSWGSVPRDLRAAVRGRRAPGLRLFFAGLRVARMLTP
jgi:formylglycine-generating enzyme required for sulfatase activity